MATTQNIPPTAYSPVVTPAQAQGINAARAQAVAAGQSPYAGNLQNLATFTANQPAPAPVTAIDASKLTPTPAFNIPTPPATTPAQNTLEGSVTSYQPPAIQTPAQTTTPTPTTDTPQNAILNRLLGYATDLDNESAFTAQTNKQYGIDDKSQAVNTLTNEYNARSRYYDDKIRKTQTDNKLGKSADAIDEEVQDLTRQKNQELGDIAVQQSAATGDLSTAQALAKQIVDAKYEPIEKSISLMGTMYGLLQNDLTESEQMQAQANIQEQQAQANLGRSKDLALYDQQIKESAPDYQLGLEAQRADIANTYSQIGERDATTVNSQVPDSAYSGVVNTILGSGKFTKAQAAQIATSINNGDDPLTVIRNNAKGLLGQTEATNVTKYEQAKSSMESIQSALAEYYAKGGSTGVFSGNYEKVINNLGQVKNPDLVDLATQIQSQLQVYRNAVSGTAYSEQEGKDINSIFPGINKSQGLNQAVISGRLKAFDSTINGTYASAIGASTYDKVQVSAGGKGSLSSSDFVEKTLSGAGKSYNTVVSSSPAGHIPVLRNDNGQLGYILPGEYNSTTYTRI